MMQSNLEWEGSAATEPLPDPILHQPKRPRISISIYDMPKLHQLKYLRVGSTKLQICGPIVCRWKRVAYGLKFEDCLVKNIEYDTYERKVQDSCVECLVRWLHGEASEPTWKNFIEALEFADFNDLARELKELLEDSAPADPPPDSCGQPDPHTYFGEEMPSIYDKPTYAQLLSLKVPIGSKQLSITQVMGSHWKDLAFGLEFQDDVVRGIELFGTNKNCVESCGQVLYRWLEGMACHPITWKKLIETLKNIQHAVLAEKLEELFRDSAPSESSSGVTQADVPDKPLSIYATPTLGQLNFLNVGGRQLRICQIVGSDWRNVAINLDLDVCLVNNIEYDSKYKPEIACVRTFDAWLTEMPCEPTWKRLIKALSDAGHNHLAKELKELLDDSSPIEAPLDSAKRIIYSAPEQPPSIYDKPKLGQLRLLNIGNQRLRVCRVVGSKWFDVALNLDLEYYVVGNIEYDTREQGCEMSCFEAFHIWLEEQPCEPTWKRLLQALRDAQLVKLADQLEGWLDDSVPAEPPCHVNQPHSTTPLQPDPTPLQSDPTPLQSEKPLSIYDKPKLKNLVILKMNNETWRLCQELGRFWKDLAYVLEFDREMVKTIEGDTSGCVQSCQETFRRWLNGEAAGSQPITWKTLIEVLKDIDCNTIAVQLEHWITGKAVLDLKSSTPITKAEDSPPSAAVQAAEKRSRHLKAYKKAIKKRSTVKIRSVRFNHIGLPRSGKTSFQLRVMGVIENILKEMLEKGAKEQPSTGVAECGGQVLIRNMRLDMGAIKSRIWSLLKDVGDEANMLNQLIYQAANREAGPSVGGASTSSACGVSAGKASSVKRSSGSLDKGGLPASPKTAVSEASPQPGLPPKKSAPSKALDSEATPTVPSVKVTEEDIEEMFALINAAMDAEDWDAVRYLLEDTILLINTDTGGQAEFLDLQASLVQGPSFNLLFRRLVDDLDSLFEVYYTNEDGVSTDKESSTMTVEEVLFQAMSSIACFSGCFSCNDRTLSDETNVSSTQEEFKGHYKSKMMFVGTYRDKVSEEEFKRKDQLLQQKIKNTEFFDKGIIEFASEDQLMIAVDNMTGSQEEIDTIRKILEKVIERSFERIPIPAAWLMLSLCIRRKKVRTMSLKDCEKLAEKLVISPRELQDALWFFHHCLGVLLYYPEIEELKDTVICDMQVVYDSASNLIRNTFTFDKVGKYVSEKFKEKAQFSLNDLKKATSVHTDDLIPLNKLIKLLEHRNVLTSIPPTPSSEGDCAQEPTFFVPSVLKSARGNELNIHLCCRNSDPAPLMLCYDCGYVPVGVFPAMITNLVSQQRKDWQVIEEGLRKNRIQFFVGDDYDTVSLISHPRYFEIVISRMLKFRMPTELLCSHVRNVILSTLDTVTSSMNYDFSMGYKFGFECPSHPGRDHLCVLAKETATCMECRQKSAVQPIPLEGRHSVWFASSVTPVSTVHSEPTSEISEVIPLSIKKLNLLKWKDEHGKTRYFRLVQRVSSEYIRIGLLLDFTLDQLEGWKMERQGNVTLCWIKVMDCWLQDGSSEYPATWEGLYTLLEDAEFPAVSSDLKKAVISAVA